MNQPKTIMGDERLSISQAAKLVGCGRNIIEAAIAARELPVITNVGWRKVWHSDLEKWLVSRTVKGLK